MSSIENIIYRIYRENSLPKTPVRLDENGRILVSDRYPSTGVKRDVILYHLDVVRERIESRQTLHPQCVVDFGSGDGYPLFEMCHQLGCSGVGLEINSESVALSKQYYQLVRGVLPDFPDCRVFQCNFFPSGYQLQSSVNAFIEAHEPPQSLDDIVNCGIPIFAPNTLLYAYTYMAYHDELFELFRTRMNEGQLLIIPGYHNDALSDDGFERIRTTAGNIFVKL